MDLRSPSGFDAVNPDAVNRLRERVKEGPVTFVFAAKDEKHNSSLLLKEYLEGKL